MKAITTIIATIFIYINSYATTHTIQVWDGYYQFLPASLTIQLGDTVEWLPLDQPMMVHTVTSTTIPAGAASFDQIWQAPADTFFRYIPQIAGVYNYVCTPHATSFSMIGTFTVLDGATDIESADDVRESFRFIPSTGMIHTPQHLLGKDYAVYNISGKLIQAGKLEPIVDVQSLKNGIYFLRASGIREESFKFDKR